MARLRGQDYRQSEKRDKLTVDDLGDSVAAVLTIADVVVGNMRDEQTASGWREVIKIGTEEFPTRWYYPNFAGVTALIEAFGEDTDEWRGRLLPLTITSTKNPRTNKPVEALHVAPRNVWRGLIEGTGEVDGMDTYEAVGANVPEPKPPRMARPVPAKSSRKAKGK